MGISTFPAAGGGVTQKVQEFTSTGTFTAPSNCSAVEVFLVGGGGGGGSCRSSGNTVAAGGGGGGIVKRRMLSVTPGASYTVTIGGGGAGGNAGAGAAGSDSSFGALLTCYGGGGAPYSDTPASTWTNGNPRGTSGGAPITGNNQIGGRGGGAASSAIGAATSTTPFTGSYASNGNWAPNAAIPITGASAGDIAGSGSLGYNTNNGGYADGGQGIEGYGAGGIGGFSASTAPGAIMQPGNISIYGGVRPAIAQTNTGVVQTAGPNAIANSGAGGNGAAIADQQGASTYVQPGGNGGSGYCRVVYWS